MASSASWKGHRRRGGVLRGVPLARRQRQSSEGHRFEDGKNAARPAAARIPVVAATDIGLVPGTGRRALVCATRRHAAGRRAGHPSLWFQIRAVRQVIANPIGRTDPDSAGRAPA